MQLQVKLNIKYETFENIIVTALEDGSNYWYILGSTEGCPSHVDMPDKARSERIAYGLWHNEDAKVHIYDVENEEDLLGILTYNSARERMHFTSVSHLCELVAMINGDFDACTADTLFQVLVMGEVVFG